MQASINVVLMLFLRYVMPVCAGKVVRLRQKLSDITGAVTGIFGRKAEQDPAVARLDSLKVLTRLSVPSFSRGDSTCTCTCTMILLKIKAICSLHCALPFMMMTIAMQCYRKGPLHCPTLSSAESTCAVPLMQDAALQERMEEAKALFRNSNTTQFIIVTIPTVMAAAESARLAEALRKEGVPVKLMLVNQVIQQAATQTFLQARRRDQQRALSMLRSDASLG